jgi:integrase/recombinase XerC
MTKQARILDDRRFKQALAACRSARERAMFLLSVKAGLRAVEIAGLNWDRIDFDGNYLLLKATKGDKPRHVPLNKELAAALLEYREERSSKAKGPVFVNTNADKGAALTAGAVAVWFHDFYGKRLGWEGYSSHSGRRTFVTNAARKVSLAGGSLRDVQALAGHADLKTTSRYIETDPDAQRKLVDLI